MFGYSKTLAITGIFTILAGIIFQIVYREESSAATVDLKI